WVPRFLCFRDSRYIPRVALAAAIAEGFLTLPTFGRRNPHAHTGVHSSFPDVDDAEVLHDDGSAPSTETATLGDPADLRPGAAHREKRPEQSRVRVETLHRIIDHGVDPYPVASAPTHTAGEAANAKPGTSVVVAGRLLRIRNFGGVLFAVLRDWSG